MKNKFNYLLNTTVKTFKRKGFFLCPSCGSKDSTIKDRKYLLTTLRRCNNCKLLYRSPITTLQENQFFYQNEYNQDFTTEMPSEPELKEYLNSNFQGTQKDFSNYIDVLKALEVKPKSKIFDFGCSWGYGSWQLSQAGFYVESFEISAPRANYARNKLGTKVYSNLSQVTETFDVFFSSHVLEHMPSIKETIDFAFRILKPEGLFIAFTPNGSDAFRKNNPKAWHNLWGSVHPNLLDDMYYKYNFSNRPFLLASNPYDIQGIAYWSMYDSTKQTTLNLEGSELLFVTKN